MSAAWLAFAIACGVLLILILGIAYPAHMVVAANATAVAILSASFIRDRRKRR